MKLENREYSTKEINDIFLRELDVHIKLNPIDEWVIVPINDEKGVVVDFYLNNIFDPSVGKPDLNYKLKNKIKFKNYIRKFTVLDSVTDVNIHVGNVFVDMVRCNLDGTPDVKIVYGTQDIERIEKIHVFLHRILRHFLELNHGVL